jgi:crotonobetainyl-CoA:carnitine CoA-transferase CaiB-like acyl-CoA transferase
MHAVMAILAALHHRNRTGEGQYIDIALFDTQLSWLANVASAYLVSGQLPQRHGNAHPSIVPYQTVPTADGLLMLAVGNDAQFARLCSLLGHTEWAADPRFATNRARVDHRTALLPLLETEFRQRSAAQWTEALLAVDVPCGPVNDIPTALADPQAHARAMVQSIVHPVTGEVPQLGPVPKLSATPARIHLPPPLLGEHTNCVLSEWLGYSAAQIADLRAAGAI